MYLLLELNICLGWLVGTYKTDEFKKFPRIVVANKSTFCRSNV